ncbi:MAG: hypothetical protein JXB39_00175 [Deltaproteobacteria bacterium]|nr:hypothetical protein [Deltaproteobacteria bacterium]
MTTKTCALVSCGRVFEAERADARYCSPTCRGKASRARRRADGDAPIIATPSRPSEHGPVEREAGHPSGLPPFPTGTHPDLIARMVSLEERVDDLEWDGREVEENNAHLGTLPARVEALARQVPGEEGMKRWAKEALLDEVGALRERLADLESVGEALAQRVAALESAELGADRNTRVQVRRMEHQVAGLDERLDGFTQDLAKLAEALHELGEVLENEVS